MNDASMFGRPVALAARVAMAVAIVVQAEAQSRIDPQSGDARGLDAAAQTDQQNSRGKTPKQAAPIDLTGYWVSIVTEDWRFRMVLPPKGDFPDVPLNDAGRKIANTWDPAKDEAGDRCKAYGAPNIMRVPGRLHITWADDNTLEIDFDAGKQTRLLHFNPPSTINAAPSRQGYSGAQWNRRALKVVTTKLVPGYLQANGVPYSAGTVMTEDFDIVKEPTGEQWLIVTAVVDDPMYLARTFIRSTHFRKQPDAAAWDPSPCSVR